MDPSNENSLMSTPHKITRPQYNLNKWTNMGKRWMIRHTYIIVYYWILTFIIMNTWYTIEQIELGMYRTSTYFWTDVHFYRDGKWRFGWFLSKTKMTMIWPQPKFIPSWANGLKDLDWMTLTYRRRKGQLCSSNQYLVKVQYLAELLMTIHSVMTLLFLTLSQMEARSDSKV